MASASPRLRDGPVQTVLVAEDDEHTRRRFAEILEAEGFAVLTAENGLQALLEVNRHYPDLLILDIGLGDPIYSGTEVCRRVKRKSPSTPVIVITGIGPPRVLEHEVVADPFGPDYFLEKPVERVNLVAYVNKVLDRSRFEARRLAGATEICWGQGRLRVHRLANRVWFDNKPIRMSPSEAKVLGYLMVRWGEPVSNTELVVDALALDPREVDVANTVRLYVGRARQKLNAFSGLGDVLIVNEKAGTAGTDGRRWPGGYRFTERVMPC